MSVYGVQVNRLKHTLSIKEQEYTQLKLQLNASPPPLPHISAPPPIPPPTSESHVPIHMSTPPQIAHMALEHCLPYHLRRHLPTPDEAATARAPAVSNAEAPEAEADVGVGVEVGSLRPCAGGEWVLRESGVETVGAWMGEDGVSRDFAREWKRKRLQQLCQRQRLGVVRMIVAVFSVITSVTMRAFAPLAIPLHTHTHTHTHAHTHMHTHTCTHTHTHTTHMHTYPYP